MTQPSNKNIDRTQTHDAKNAESSYQTLGPPDLARLKADFDGMKLIPWRDI